MFDALITKLEAATEGSQIFDVQIYRHLFLPVGTSLTRARNEAPPYTRSLDAAMQLVPEDIPLHTRRLNVEGEVRHEACVNYAPWRTGTTLALAICIASLKARRTD